MISGADMTAPTASKQVNVISSQLARAYPATNAVDGEDVPLLEIRNIEFTPAEATSTPGE